MGEILIKFFSYIRSALMVAVYPFFLILTSIVAIVLNFIFNSRKVDNFCVKWWATISCAMFGVKVKIHGKEHTHRHGCLYVFNHSSFFDIFAMASVIPNFRFGAKIELFSIPFFGYAMKRFGALPIARGKRAEVIGIYEKAKDRVIKGENFALAAEGGRQKNEDVLAPFKAGPFIFAISAQAPIVPVIIRNAGVILDSKSFIPNKFRWHDTISIHVLTPMETKEYTLERRNELKDKVRDIFLQNKDLK